MISRYELYVDDLYVCLPALGYDDILDKLSRRRRETLDMTFIRNLMRYMRRNGVDKHGWTAYYGKRGPNTTGELRFVPTRLTRGGASLSDDERFSMKEGGISTVSMIQTMSARLRIMLTGQAMHTANPRHATVIRRRARDVEYLAEKMEELLEELQA